MPTAAASRPRSCRGHPGQGRAPTSSLITETSPGTSSRPKALTYRTRSSRPGALSGQAGLTAPTPLAASVPRARWRALVTDGTLVPRSSAASLARNRSTSQRRRAARWRGDRCRRAAARASRSASLRAAISAGSLVGASPGSSGSSSTGSGRRARLLSMSRQTLVAMRWSHPRRAVGRLRPLRLRHARTSVSCTASSASRVDPSMRTQCRVSSWRWRSSACSSAAGDGSSQSMPQTPERPHRPASRRARRSVPEPSASRAAPERRTLMPRPFGHPVRRPRRRDRTSGAWWPRTGRRRDLPDPGDPGRLAPDRVAQPGPAVGHGPQDRLRDVRRRQARLDALPDGGPGRPAQAVRWTGAETSWPASPSAVLTQLGSTSATEIPKLRQLVAQRLGVALQSELAGGVDGEQRDGGEPEERADVDDPLAPGPAWPAAAR